MISLVMFPGITAEMLCVRVMSLVMSRFACEAGSRRLMSVVMLQDVPGDVGCSGVMSLVMLVHVSGDVVTH